MGYWLVKSEPSAYSWEQLNKDGVTDWSGVKNPQALIYLRAMKNGDPCFFYHSGTGLEIVGIAEIARSFYPDPKDKTGKLGMVDIKPRQPLKTPVTLAAIKAEPKLADLGLVRQSRLSVMPVDEKSWKLICAMGGMKP
jgi:predicted RNA-binding protein with PUA-like domain